MAEIRGNRRSLEPTVKHRHQSAQANPAVLVERAQLWIDTLDRHGRPATGMPSYTGAEKSMPGPVGTMPVGFMLGWL